MLTTQAFHFLRAHYPFDLLPEAELQRLAQAAALDFYPKGTRVLAQDGEPSQHLYVIQKGRVQMTVRADTGPETVIDTRGPGEYFGLSSMRRAAATLFDITAVEDTLCYLFPKPAVAPVLERNAEFGETLLEASMQRYLTHSLRAFRRSAGAYPGHERLLFTLPVRALVKRGLLSCAPEAAIQQAAQMMTTHRVSSLVVVDAAHQPVGILTDRDLRSKVVAAMRDPREPVAAIMSAPVHAVAADDSVMEALLAMLRRNIHHLLVLDQGQPLGVVTSTDLILLQGASPLLYAKEMERQTSVAGLAAALQRANALWPLMFQEGARPSVIARVQAELNDQVTTRLLALAEAELGRPPVPYCWLVLGSEGRKEQTYKTDQDNALLYADPEDAAQAAAAADYFERLADYMRDALAACGYPLCPGNYMASNAAWRQPLREWRRAFTRWITTPEPEEVLRATIFFDLRAAGGAHWLADDLRATLAALIRGRGLFLAHMARLATQHTPALGLFGHFAVEGGGPHKGAFDLKLRGTGPLVDLVRVLALEHGVAETNTFERLRTLEATGAIAASQVGELKDALEFLMALRLRHQLAQAAQGQPPDNYLHPGALSPLDRTTLKEALQVIARNQTGLSEQYMTGRLG